MRKYRNDILYVLFIVLCFCVSGCAIHFRSPVTFGPSASDVRKLCDIKPALAPLQKEPKK